MAMSKPVVPDIVLEEPVIAQHYLVCGNGNCEKNCQFYCNPCPLPLDTCVNNAETNIRKIQTPRMMKWFLTKNADINFL